YLLTCRSTQDGHLNKTHEVTIDLNDTKLRLIRSLKSLNRGLLLLLLGAKIILRLLGQMLLNFSLSRLICFTTQLVLYVTYQRQSLNQLKLTMNASYT